MGGCATGLLITDKAAPPVRQTIDVDVIVEVASRLAFNQLEKRLRARGFANDLSEYRPKTMELLKFGVGRKHSANPPLTY